MSKFLITGGRKLEGEFPVAGNKNAALPILAATVLTDEECVLRNVPRITDVETMLALLADLGKTVTRKAAGEVTIAGAAIKSVLNNDLVQRMCASILLLGPLLARFGQAMIGPPGGCVIGKRAAGTHFDALTALGAKIIGADDNYRATLAEPHPARIFLDEVSVTATENAMLCAALIPGETVIENAACDPHRVLITGPTQLRAQKLSSPDIRAGIALVIAALMASGTCTIDHAELVDRGYEDIVRRLRQLGAVITRED